MNELRGIGIIGVGCVGKAMLKGYQTFGFNVVGYDKFKDDYKNFEPILNTEVVFLCLPTIAQGNGQMDLSPFDETFEKLKDYKGLIVIKSTVIPGTTDKYQEQYPDLKIVHSPEFLREKTSQLDFFTPHKIVLGFANDLSKPTGDELVFEKMDEIYSLFEAAHCIFNCKIDITSAKTSEFMKFMSNSFFATKVVFANEMNEIAQFYGADYEFAKEMLYRDPRIGKDHLGINKERRYSGMCLPKDVNQLLANLKGQNIIPELLAKVKEVNDRDVKLQKVSLIP